jgi:hypothetical protein
LQKTLSRKYPSQKRERASEVAEGEGPEFKPQYCKEKKKKRRKKKNTKNEGSWDLI